MQHSKYGWLLLGVPFLLAAGSSIFVYLILQCRSIDEEGRLDLAAMVSHSMLVICLALAVILAQRWSRLAGLPRGTHLLIVSIVLMPLIYTETDSNTSTVEGVVFATVPSIMSHGSEHLGLIHAINGVLFFALVALVGLVSYPRTKREQPPSVT
jgi:hypothetical protein